MLISHLQQDLLLQVFICSVQQLLGPQYSIPHHVLSTTSKRETKREKVSTDIYPFTKKE